MSTRVRACHIGRVVRVSVDITQLAAHLDPERKQTVIHQYERRHTSATAAFLLCFFLGYAGAHRFYLRQWGVALAHLALFAVGVVALTIGLLNSRPLTTLGLALDVVGGVFLLASLIWEIVDLSRIDHQVYGRNLLLAEGLIATTMLADKSILDETARTLDRMVKKAAAQSQTPQPTPAAPTMSASSTMGLITPEEVASARALAEESAGAAAISYSAISQFNVSDDPDEARNAQAEAAREGDWTETATQRTDAGPSETVTRSHTEDGARITDSYEVDRFSGPLAAEVAGLAGLGAVGLGAGALAAADLTRGDAETSDSLASFDETTQPDHAPEPAEAHAPEPAAAPLDAAHAAQTTSGGYDDEDFDDIGDITDAGLPAVMAPAADIAFAHASPAYIHLPEEEAAPDATSEPMEALDAPAEAPLYFIPDEPTAPVWPDAAPEPEPTTLPPSAEAPAEAYVPPVPPVYSAPEPAPAPILPSWEEPTAIASAPEPTPESAAPPPPADDNTLAELAGFGALAGAGALTGAALAHQHAEPAPEPIAAESAPIDEPTPQPTPEPVAAPPPPKMKRIRVKRRIMLDGQVVREEVVEREVPADMDSAEAAARIEAELSHATPEQIAQLAHLSPDEEVQVRQRMEGTGGGQQG